MPASFVDTSALVKLYVQEVGSSWMAREIEPNGIAVSNLTITEIGTTLARRTREGTMPARQALAVWRNFTRDLRKFLTFEVSRLAARRAAAIAARSSVPLRALDAIQLQGALDAAADARARGLPVPQFVTADTRLELAAQVLGFATDNPLRHP